MDTLLGLKDPWEDYELWQDREIRFDVTPAHLSCRPGEAVLEVLDPVEDVKGNSGDKGKLIITDLRLIWFANDNKRTNITIGLSCLQEVTAKPANSRLKGDIEALLLLTRYKQQRFEFIFASTAKDGSVLVNNIHVVWKAHTASSLYRDLKLRGAVIQGRELKVLPLEQVYSKVAGVWNLSSEQGNLGTFFISSVRVVWFANLADNFNVSIPYIQMTKVSVRESKYGKALVIETSPSAGSYVLGFKVDPKGTLDYVLKEVTSLRKAYLQQPQFGVTADMHAAERAVEALAALKLQQGEEDVAVVDAGSHSSLLVNYYAEPSSQDQDREPVYCPELGLAIEALKDGITIDQLWSAL